MIVKVNASWVLCRGPGSRSRECNSLLHARSAWSTAKVMIIYGMGMVVGGPNLCKVNLGYHQVESASWVTDEDLDEGSVSGSSCTTLCSGKPDVLGGYLAPLRLAG